MAWARRVVQRRTRKSTHRPAAAAEASPLAVRDSPRINHGRHSTGPRRLRRSARSTTSSLPTRASAATAASSSALGFYNPMAAGGEQPLRVALDRLTLLVRRRRAASPTVTRLVEQAKAAPARPDTRGSRAAYAAPALRTERRWSAPGRRSRRCPPTRSKSAASSTPGASRAGIKVLPYPRDPQALVLVEALVPACARSGCARRPLPCRALLQDHRTPEHGDAVVARRADVADRNAAEALRGARIFVPRSSFPTAGDDEYYWVDLIGLAVVNREGCALGRSARSDRHRRRTACCVRRTPARTASRPSA